MGKIGCMSVLTVPEPKSFTDFAEANQLEDNDFPYARKGPKLRRLAASSLTRLIPFLVGYLIIKYFAGPYYYDWAKNQPEGGTLAGGRVSQDAVMVQGAKALFYVGTALKWISIALAIRCVWRWGRYLLNVIRRCRCFERDVWKNDKEANKFRHHVLQQGRIPQQIAEFNRSEQKSKRSAAGSSNQEAYHRSLSDDARIKALKNICKMEVLVNTRQSTSGDEIIRTHRMEIPLPSTTGSYDEIKNMISGFGLEANRLPAKKKGLTPTHFPSEPTYHSNGILAVFQSSAAADDKWAVPIVGSDDAVEEVDYTPTYSLTLYKDRTADINRARREAEKQLKANQKTVENVLSSNGLSVYPRGFEVGASSGLIIFERASETKQVNYDSILDPLNASFKTNSVTIDVEGNRFLVSVPLKKSAIVPIDVKSMLEEAFF